MAGEFRGEYTEDDFDVGQQLPTPYHQTKFEAELLVRSAAGLRYRVYRPAVVVGDSRTGEMDKIDGPYYFFGLLAKLAVLPRFTPMVLPDTGRTNIVPVDFVVEALVELMHADGRDGQAFHLTAPKTIGLRGIYRGTIHLDERELDWRADHHMGEHFTLREAGYVLAKFDAGSDAQPVSVALFGLDHLETLPLLFCCHIVKRVVDMTMEAGSPGAPQARGQ